MLALYNCMSRQVYILLIVMLGFFLIPTEGYACGTRTVKTEKTCHENGSSGKIKNYCKNNHGQNDKDDCSRQCENTMCHCPTMNVAAPLTFPIQLKRHLLYLEKLNPPYTETYLSSVFLSIWIPPKIS